jgi:hypothetical protein
LARAKSTERAAARRRYRAAQIEASQAADESGASGEPSAAKRSPSSPATGAPAGRGSLFGFRIPDFGADLRAVPGVVRAKPYVLIPFGLVTVGAILAALPNSSDIVRVVVYFTFYPSPALMYFAAGFIAPRGSYLFGGALGLLDAVLLTTIATAATRTSAGAASPTPSAVISYITTQVLLGAFFAGFSSWYRDFLRRSSQQRAQANRTKQKAQQRPQSKRSPARSTPPKSVTPKGAPTPDSAAKPTAPPTK